MLLCPVSLALESFNVLVENLALSNCIWMKNEDEDEFGTSELGKFFFLQKYIANSLQIDHIWPFA